MSSWFCGDILGQEIPNPIYSTTVPASWDAVTYELIFQDCVHPENISTN